MKKAPLLFAVALALCLPALAQSSPDITDNSWVDVQISVPSFVATGPLKISGSKQPGASVTVPSTGCGTGGNCDFSFLVGPDNQLHCQLSAALGGGSCGGGPTGLLGQPLVNGGTSILTSTPSYVDTSVLSGSSWCDRVMAADAQLGSAPGEIWVNNNSGTLSSCEQNIALSAGHVVKFKQGGTYVLGSYNIAPAGVATGVLCNTWDGTVLSYTGSGYAYDVNTEAYSVFDGCMIRIGASALGGARLQQQADVASHNRITHTLIYSPTYTAGQIGVLLYTDNATDAIYWNNIDISTLNVDIGVSLQSAASVANGPNANDLRVTCQGHTICAQIKSGANNHVVINAGGAQGSTGGTGIQCGGAGSGNYGCSTNQFFGVSEQGGTSTSLSFLSGANVNSFDFMPNDTTAVSDTSSVSTNRGSFGGVLYHVGVNDTAAASNCNAITGGGTTAAAGCVVVNLGSATRYIPYY